LLETQIWRRRAPDYQPFPFVPCWWPRDLDRKQMQIGRADKP